MCTLTDVRFLISILFITLHCQHLDVVFGRLQKNVTLNPDRIFSEGVMLYANPLVTTIVDHTYDILVQRQEDDYDICVRMDQTWSYRPQTASTLHIVVDGIAPLPQAQMTGDTDLLFVFAVGDLQYFSFFVHLDEANMKSRIFPSLSNNTVPVSEWLADDTIHERWARISNDDQWLMVHDWNKPVLWPLHLQIANDPQSNTAQLQLYHNSPSQYAFGWTFHSAAFEQQRSIDLYIMGDSTGERYRVSSVNVQLWHDEDQEEAFMTSSVTPTDTPSMFPTFAPPRSSFAPPIAAVNVTRSTDSGDGEDDLMIQSSSALTNMSQNSLGFYVVWVRIVFHLQFPDNDLKTVFGIIQLMMHEVNDTTATQCPYYAVVVSMFESHYNLTLIELQVSVCSDEQQSDLVRWLTSTNSSLQPDLLRSINDETSLNVSVTEVWISATAAESDMQDSINDSDSDRGSNNNDDGVVDAALIKDQPTKSPLLWMVVFITAQVSSCLMLIGCVVCIRLKTQSLQKEQTVMKEEISLHTSNLSNISMVSPSQFAANSGMLLEPGSVLFASAHDLLHPTSPEHIDIAQDLEPSSEARLRPLSGSLAPPKPYKVRSLAIIRQEMEPLSPPQKAALPTRKASRISNCNKTRGVSEDIYDPEPAMITKGFSTRSSVRSVLFPQQLCPVRSCDDEDNEDLNDNEHQSREGASVRVTPTYSQSTPELKPNQSLLANNMHGADEEIPISPTPTISFQLPTYQVTRRQWI
mmetsp:Transcript_35012/g.57185  ORF Transcript_35012/g.57185 Transcript_35012/m.57185 type:complete len:748 (-) Transcript_35012:76-2319(-)